MSDTHPNAFRVEAAEKRAQATQLNAEAKALEDQADTLEFPDGKPKENAEGDSKDRSEPEKKKLFSK